MMEGKDTSSKHKESKEHESRYKLEEFKSWAGKHVKEFVDEGDTVCSEEFPKVQTCDEVLPDMKATKFFDGAMAEAYSTEHDPRAAFTKPVESLKGWSMELNEVFAEKYGMTPNSVMLLGPAGSGKTTAMKRFLRDSPDFNIMLCGRTSQISKEKVSVRDFIFPDKSGISETALEKGFKWMKANPHKVNFFMDSLDTVPHTEDLSSDQLIKTHDEELHPPAKILSSIMARSLFSGCKVFSTSREHGIVELPQELQPDRVVALVGLSKESTKKIIHSKMQDKGEQFCSTVETRCPGLWSLMSNPLFLIFTLISRITEKIKETFTPSTLSGILIMILNELSRSDHGRNIATDTVMGKLKKLSYKGILEGKVTFDIEDLDHVGLTKEDTSAISIHAPVRERHCEKRIKVLQGSNRIFFCHQCVQEVLAALFVIDMDYENFKDFVSKEMKKPRLSLVRRFIAGILMNEKVLKSAESLLDGGLKTEDMDIKQKQDFFCDAVREELRTARKKLDILELYLTLYEAGEGLKEIIYSGIRSINLCGSLTLSDADMHAVGSVVKYCHSLKTLNISDCGLEFPKMKAFSSGLGDCTIKVTEFQLADNWELGEDGLHALVQMLKMFKSEKVALDGCDLKADDLKSFALALRQGGIKVNKLSIQKRYDYTATHEMVEAVKDLLPQINQTMDLDGWEFSEADKKEIEEKLTSENNMNPSYYCCVEFGWTSKRTIHAKRFEDYFKELLKSPEFSSVKNMKKFARSGDGLCLTSVIVQDIEDDCDRRKEDAYHLRLAFLEKWRQLTDSPSVSKLEAIVCKYKDAERMDMLQSEPRSMTPEMPESDGKDLPYNTN